jgi:hypothetical protein
VSGRTHVSGHEGNAEAHLIVTWPDGATLADVEEATKKAARAAVRDVRDRMQAHR